MKILYKLFIKNYKNTKNPEIVEKYGILSGFFGIVCNAFLFIVKIVIALISHSISIISDAFNNLSDASNSIITLIGFKMSSKPADKEHPFGHQRIEYVCAFLIAIVIMFVGVELGLSSIKKIINPTETNFSYVILSIMVITILVKLFMYFYYTKTSRIINSISLKANARDSINDVITTSSITIGLLIGKIFNINLDGYLGMAVCIYIAISGLKLIKETIDKLIGGTLDVELISIVKKEILKDKNILGIHDVLYHYYGNGQIYVSLHVEMDSSIPLIDAHDIIDKLEKKINKMFNIELLIHIDPVILNDKSLNEISQIITEIIKSIDDSLNYHELKVTNKEDKTIISFDIEIPYEYNLTNKEIYSIINRKLRIINKNYRISINFDNY